MLNTVLAGAVLQTLCWRSFGRTLLGTHRRGVSVFSQDHCCFFSKRTLVQFAANDNFEPSFDNAAPYANVSLQPIKKSSLT